MAYQVQNKNNPQVATVTDQKQQALQAIKKHHANF
jgi:hypothetical protein